MREIISRREKVEWQRMIAQAALGGVTFTQSVNYYDYKGKKFILWYATLPDGRVIDSLSKYSAARMAVEAMTREEGK